MKLNEAKQILLDKEKRKEYDEFLNNKDSDTYQKYRNEKNVEKEVTKEEYSENYEAKMVTKWEYLSEYLKLKDIKLFRRIIALIFVLLESFLCFFLKIFIITLSFLCYFLSNIIILLLKFISPIIFLVCFYLAYIFITSGFNKIINENIIELRGVISFTLIYIFAIILTVIGEKLISQKVFDLLYKKIDVYLFKKAVGYKN